MNPISDQVRSYLREQQQFHPQSLAKTIVAAAKVLTSPVEKWALAQQISKEFHQKGIDPQKVVLLKTAIYGAGWRNGIVEVHYQVNIDAHYPFLCYTNHLDCPIELKPRTHFFSYQNMQAVMGSTFATNKQDRLDTQGHHILDSIFGSACANGYVLALGDGAGGHFGDAHQDRRISRASHFATKTCARLFAAYDDPQELYKNLLPIVTTVAKEIQQKAVGEGTTLTGCRLFRTNQGWRIIGINIGDSMLIAWHPPSQKIYHLCPSHVTEAGTAFLPQAYRSFEVQTIDALLPFGSCLFLMSDGIHDYLPFTEEERTYQNGLSYRIRTLTRLEDLLISPKTALQTLVQTCIHRAEQERQSNQQANTSIGDDISLLQCNLP